MTTYNPLDDPDQMVFAPTGMHYDQSNEQEIQKEKSMGEDVVEDRPGDPTSPMRQKYWSELSLPEKVERMREQVRHLQDEDERRGQMIYRLQNHEHLASGLAAVPLKGEFYAGRRPDGDDVYF